MNNYDDIMRIIDQSFDPNNGILSNPSCHKLFDSVVVWFDTDGNLCFRSESKDIVEKLFGKNSNEIRIKQNVFNHRMQEYMKKKNTLNK